MAEENQGQQGPAPCSGASPGPVVPAEPQQVTTKEPQRVTMKDPKKVEVGKRLVAINHKKREVKGKEQAQLEKTASGVNQYYDIGAVIALGVIGGLGYYIYQSKKGPAIKESRMFQCHIILLSNPLRLTSSRWIKSLLYYKKNGQEEYSK